MGVMSCNRKGCEEIMCNRYSSTFGYICNDCFEELKESVLPPEIFMESDKKIKKYSEKLKDFHNELMEQEFPIK